MLAWNLWQEWWENSVAMAAAPWQVSPFHACGAPFAAPSDELEEVEYLKRLGGLTACRVDASGHALHFSPNWETVIGMMPSRCSGSGFDKFFHPAHRTRFLNCLKEVLENAQAEGPTCFRAQYGTTHQGYRWYEFRLFPEEVDGTKQVGMLLRDITPEIQSERTVKTAQVEAELALKGRTEFLGHMSHELRTPLNAILGFAQMMEKGVHGAIDQSVYQEYLANIRESGGMLLERINDMLEIASIEVGDRNLREVRVEPDDIIEAAHQLYHHQAFDHHVTICTPIACPLVVLRCDRAKLTRAVGNLLSNAIRFSEYGQEVEISCRLEEDGGFSISVRDGGQGMAAGQLSALQAALRKSDCLLDDNPDTVCLGLGLSVAKGFAQLHEGALTITSRRGHGTVATITLPPERVTSLEAPRRRRVTRRESV